MIRFRSLANAFLQKERQALAAKGVKPKSAGWWGWMTGDTAEEEVTLLSVKNQLFDRVASTS